MRRRHLLLSRWVLVGCRRFGITISTTKHMAGTEERSRLTVINPANFLQERFWIARPSTETWRALIHMLRPVDVHSPWVGLAMLLMVLGAVFDHVGFAERIRLWIAIVLLSGATIFPLSVLLQTATQGPLTNLLAIGGAAL
jgi:hypothetical protein